MASTGEDSGVRLAELIAALSLGTDLGLGMPMEHALRGCVLALGMADRLEFAASERATVYYVGLLAYVGCHSDSFEQAKWFGDDIKARADAYLVEMAGAGAMRYAMGHVGSGRPPLERARTVAQFMASGPKIVAGIHFNHCELASELAHRLGLGDSVCEALLQVFERWDGAGDPGKRGGADINRAVRLMHVADVVEVHHRRAGIEAALDVARRRRGSQFDPEVVDCFCEEAHQFLAPLSSATSWDAVIAAEPGLRRTLSDPELDATFEAIADFTDLKSPYTLGHSRGVADLAAEAGRLEGLAEDEVTLLRRAALVHDLGRLGVPNTIWDKPGELSVGERERVRLHPYLTERILSSATSLARIGVLAGSHHERLDGSGYPRGLRANALSRPARILAAADVYHAMIEPRPHRPALTSAEAASRLTAEVRDGRLDGDAVDAVLRAAGHEVTERPQRPAGLTAREVEILVQIARGSLNKEIAQRLAIAPKTVGNHVQNIYAKIGVSSRAAAALFATEHGLLASAPADHPAA